jgi:hypothetical protein
MEACAWAFDLMRPYSPPCRLLLHINATPKSHSPTFYEYFFLLFNNPLEPVQFRAKLFMCADVFLGSQISVNVSRRMIISFCLKSLNLWLPFLKVASLYLKIFSASRQKRSLCIDLIKKCALKQQLQPIFPYPAWHRKEQPFGCWRTIEN